MLNPRIWPTHPSQVGRKTVASPCKGRAFATSLPHGTISLHPEKSQEERGEGGTSCRPTVCAPEVTQQIRSSSFPGDEEVRESRYVFHMVSTETNGGGKYLVTHIPSLFSLVVSSIHTESGISFCLL